MSTPAEIVESMKSRFNTDAAAGVEEVFQFNIEDADDYHLIINDGSLDIVSGTHDDPSVTLIMDSETLAGVMSGEIDGMQAFMMGKLRAEGNMMLATKLGAYFPN
ncbi:MULTISPECIES: SCP2 sterol-binding domain-containing protein [Gammaproteobacteria]|uniref:SCP2 sterol-binding domain-containing protein n=1 Tax=Gammaproteobacteria TaxID=1236 RepID=UPI001ADC84B3|nr:MULTISPECIES: SCP2 sterol-binding domain-containing protein [Gammaproteobacteria]MBO9483535.1 SCP2 sterol-binding domain-containing protein [Salinisphaera sp. G21_0]MBO9495719.1 SCP2 sterol-binding domain-containing protein [Thalassotalea sp. G20_0]